MRYWEVYTRFLTDPPGYVYLEFWKGKELIAFTNPVFIEG